MNPYELQVFRTQMDACDFQDSHFCAACWDYLVNRPESGGWVVECVRCGADTKGYITRKHVKRRFEESEQRSRAAKDAMRDYVPWLNTIRQTQAQNLSDLGF